MRVRSGQLKPLPKIKNVSVNKMNISFAMVYLIIIRGNQKTLKNGESKTNEKGKSYRKLHRSHHTRLDEHMCS